MTGILLCENLVIGFYMTPLYTTKDELSVALEHPVLDLVNNEE
ncbi:MAG: hypothetical protein O4804_08260 [Trichodesmium sp. St11_bin5]|nr:hypothetical protein [Trichodesmium sp. St11_bin5]